MNELDSLQIQVKAVSLKDKLVKQKLHKDMKKVVEPVFDTIENTSDSLTKTLTESSKENNKALGNLNSKVLEIKNDRGIIASYLMSHSSNITNLENTTQFKLIKNSNSNRVNDLLKDNSKPNTLHDNLLTFRDTSKLFEIKGDLLKMKTNENYNVDLASLSDKKLVYDSAKQMLFDVKCPGNKNNRYRTLIKLLKSPVSMVFASGVSKTIFLPTDPHELCDRLK